MGEMIVSASGFDVDLFHLMTSLKIITLCLAMK